MSITYNLFCARTLTTIWVGQGNVIYTGDGSVMHMLTKFLHCNSGKPLYFLSCKEMTDLLCDVLPVVSPPTEWGSVSSTLQIKDFCDQSSLQLVSREVYEYIESYLNSKV